LGKQCSEKLAREKKKDQKSECLWKRCAPMAAIEILVRKTLRLEGGYSNKCDIISAKKKKMGHGSSAEATTEKNSRGRRALLLRWSKKNARRPLRKGCGIWSRNSRPRRKGYLPSGVTGGETKEGLKKKSEVRAAIILAISGRGSSLQLGKICLEGERIRGTSSLKGSHTSGERGRARAKPAAGTKVGRHFYHERKKDDRKSELMAVPLKKGDRKKKKCRENGRAGVGLARGPWWDSGYWGT